MNSNQASDIQSKLLTKKYAHSILKLAKWLDSSPATLNELNNIYLNQKLNNNSNYVLPTSSAIQEISQNLTELLCSKNVIFKSESHTNSHLLIGDLLDFATNIYPNSGKTWLAFADWCFNWGKKNADQIFFGNSTTKTDKEQCNMSLFDNLPAHTSNEEKAHIMSLLSEDFKLDSDANFMTEMKHSISNNCKTLSTENIENLIDEWKNITSKVIYYYKLACRSYFIFLKLNYEVS